MDDNLVEAMMMAFAVIVFVIALTLTLYMFSTVTSTSEFLIYNSDSTRFYENIELRNSDGLDVAGLGNDVLGGNVRVVDSSTIIPTLYRYYKENFCVKIYDATEAGANQLSAGTGARLIQIFDVSLEGQVNKAVTDSNTSDQSITNAPTPDERASRMRNRALIDVYNDEPTAFGNWATYSLQNRLYMFGAPWIGSTENTKKRIDYFVNGTEGYINNQYVNYIGNCFARAIRANSGEMTNTPPYVFTERFISYSYTGDTVETDDGDVLVTGAASKDKIVIIYTILSNPATDSLLVNN